jgi:hypothetical protein
MQKVNTNVIVIDGKEKDVERVKICLEVVVEPPGAMLEVCHRSHSCKVSSMLSCRTKGPFANVPQIIDCSSDVPDYHRRRHQHTGKHVSPDARTYPSFETARTVASTRPPVETQGSLLSVLKIATAADYFTPASFQKLSASESAELHTARDKLCGPKGEARVRKLKPWAWHSPGVFSERRKIGRLVKLEGPLVRLGICRTEEQYYKDEARKRIVEGRKEAEGKKEVESARESANNEDVAKEEDSKKEQDSEKAEDGENDEKCEKIKVWWKVEKWMKAEKGAKVEESRKVAGCSKGTHGQKFAGCSNAEMC